MYEAVFRQFPSQYELDLLTSHYNTQKLVAVKKGDKEEYLPSVLKNNLVTVNYKQFCEDIGAAKIVTTEDL